MIEDPPLLTLARDFPRPDPALVERFRGIPTGWAVDAMGGRAALASAIKPLPGAPPAMTRLFGVALPCECGPADNLAIFGAIALAQPGDVILAGADGFTELAVAGDLVLAMAKNKGVAGLVVDGAVRDLAGCLAVGLPTFCRAITPDSGMRNGPGKAGLPAMVGGVRVAPGDLVIADTDGVVVLPQARLPELARALDAVKAAEADLEAKVKAGLAVPDWIESLLRSERTKWVG